VEKVMGEIPFDIIDTKEVAFRCRCDLDKVVAIVSALEEEDIQKALESQGCLEVCCNFCGEEYSFSEKEIQLIRRTSSGEKL
jgi:molecular chaperone Hsp33